MTNIYIVIFLHYEKFPLNPLNKSNDSRFEKFEIKMCDRQF